MKRLVGIFIVAALLARPFPAHATIERPGDILGPMGPWCSAWVERPEAPGTLLYEWVTVTCNRPVEIVIITTIRTESFLPGYPEKVVAANAGAYFGYTHSFLTRTTCTKPPQVAPGLWGGFYVASALISTTWNGDQRIGAATTGPRFLPCGNGAPT